MLSEFLGVGIPIQFAANPFGRTSLCREFRVSLGDIGPNEPVGMEGFNACPQIFQTVIGGGLFGRGKDKKRYNEKGCMIERRRTRSNWVEDKINFGWP